MLPSRPFLHQTDCFRPPIDPDDHWDLACVFALASQGAFDLQGVLLDYPPATFPGRSPDVNAIAQLSYLTGIPASFAVGSSQLFRPATWETELTDRDRAGAGFVLSTLRQATEPVVITIVGSCRDVALAATIEPSLFAEKCAAIYLNAGTGSPDPARVPQPEYNVALNPEAYAAIFRIPCPIYWMPCFEDVVGQTEVREFGTWFKFRQGDILPHLPPGLQAYFAYSLEGRTDSRYLRPIAEPGSDVASFTTHVTDRNMWCTAGFLHAAGASVTRAGRIVPLAEVGDHAVFEFLPVSIDCADDATMHWQLDERSNDRFIFRVRDRTAYTAAMTAALRAILESLG